MGVLALRVDVRSAFERVEEKGALLRHSRNMTRGGERHQQHADLLPPRRSTKELERDKGRGGVRALH